MVLVYLLSAVMVLSLVLQIVTRIQNQKEIKTMTVEKFKDKVNGFVEKRDGAGLSAFVKRNFIFILKHGNELEDFAKGICGSNPDSVENLKGGEKID